MHENIRDSWIAALRSGEYVQGRKMLRSPGNAYCCLGVLCDLYTKHNDAKLRWEQLSDTWYIGDRSAVLPSVVSHWAGLRDSNPASSVMLGSNRLFSELNDVGWTFAQIADQIEKDL